MNEHSSPANQASDTPAALPALTESEGDRHPHAGRNGNVPPVQHRWKPGQSGNPNGRRSAGLSLIEWANSLRKKREAELVAIRDDVGEPVLKRAAARHLLQLIDVDNGDAGSAFDRICDRTEGKPRQAVDVAGELKSLPPCVIMVTPPPQRAARPGEIVYPIDEDTRPRALSGADVSDGMTPLQRLHAIRRRIEARADVDGAK